MYFFYTRDNCAISLLLFTDEEHHKKKKKKHKHHKEHKSLRRDHTLDRMDSDVYNNVQLTAVIDGILDRSAIIALVLNLWVMKSVFGGSVAFSYWCALRKHTCGWTVAYCCDTCGCPPFMLRKYEVISYVYPQQQQNCAAECLIENVDLKCPSPPTLESTDVRKPSV